jgi:hypothetical protein
LKPLVVALVLVAAATASARALTVALQGNAEPVFRWTTDRCAADDFPDAPARAFRTADGVRLIVANVDARALAGPSLARLRRICEIVHAGGGKDDPGAYDDRVRLGAFWTVDGRSVYALADAAFLGHLRAGICRGEARQCWRNAIVELVSIDGGRRFGPAGAPPALVAGLPFKFDSRAGRPTGLFSPSNIVALDRWLHAFVFAEASGAQKRGACLLRTDRLADPAAWRAWNGSAFAVRFADPYRGDVADPAAHACAPLPGITTPITSLVRHAASGRFIALTTTTRERDGRRVSGVWAIESADLIRWSDPKLVVELPLTTGFGCDQKAAWAHPSLIDPDSVSPSFDTVGQRAQLYLTRNNIADCRLTTNRDLMRYPVELRN